MIGHGGIVVFDDTADFGALARHAMAFCAFESCGKCTPCRIGSTRGTELIEELLASKGQDNRERIALLRDLCDVMTAGSLCALGGMTPAPVLSILQHFPAALGAETQTQRSLS
jgi:formate dehydrogenase iron-sulfur subunit